MGVETWGPAFTGLPRSFTVFVPLGRFEIAAISHFDEGSSSMKIKCPNCSTSYEIKPDALGAEGRSVKCARCGNRWFVAPRQEDEDEPLEEAKAAAKDVADWTDDAAEEERNVADKAEIQTPADEEADLSSLDQDIDQPEKTSAPEPAMEAPENTPQLDDAEDTEDKERPIDIETMANRPKIKVNRNKFKRNRFGQLLNWLMRRNYRRIAGVVLFASAITLCALLVLVRDNIVKQAPDLASLFEAIGLEVNLRGLEFRDLRTFREIEDGKLALVVEGSIRNINPETTPGPAVHLSIRGSDLQEIYAWTVEPRIKMLKGLDETRFRTILSDPPVDAADIQVRFIDRGQNQVVLE